MSQAVKEALRYLYGGIAAACSILFAFYLNAEREDERERDKKIDYIYVQSISQNIRDSLQTLQIAGLEARMKAHEEETESAIVKIMHSLMDSKQQLTDLERSERLKNIQ